MSSVAPPFHFGQLTVSELKRLSNFWGGIRVETRIWLLIVGPCDSLTFETVAGRLGKVGVTAYDPSQDVHRAPGMILFNEANQRLYDIVKEWSHYGCERLLAVSISRSTLINDAVWSLLAAGASDVLVWDGSANPAEEIAARFERWNAVDQLVDSSLVRKSLVGRSPAWISSIRQIAETARFTNESILITGESGTGKELAARLIHALDPRLNKGDWVVVDCTTIVPQLAGSEFFGHERGAFTGAATPRDGAFALADGGTLFLDEVGELLPELQAQLLRVIQEGTYKRVGGNTWQKTDFRLVCATNRDLLQEVAAGRFRGDLYHRIATWVVKLPPLRDRVEDIPLLVDHFLKNFRQQGSGIELDEPVRDYLMRRNYPGNVRDLKQLIARISRRHTGPGPITVGAIPSEDRPLSERDLSDWCNGQFRNGICQALALGVGLKEIGRTAENTAVQIAVRNENGNLQIAAKKLGVTDRALQMRRAALRQQPEEHS